LKCRPPRRVELAIAIIAAGLPIDVRQIVPNPNQVPVSRRGKHVEYLPIRDFRLAHEARRFVLIGRARQRRPIDGDRTEQNLFA
jgi:hypothetical protein